MSRMYVIARYNEDPSWHESFDDSEVSVITKNIDTPNIGRESSSWLLWILNNYCKLPDYVTFLQGNPFDHTTMESITEEPTGRYMRHGQLLECDAHGSPHHNGLNMRTGADIMGVELKGVIPFCMGAQFTVSRDNLMKYSYEKYAELFKYSICAHNAPWELERLWESFYNC